jgi:predicted O-methyltransferase YrrM
VDSLVELKSKDGKDRLAISASEGQILYDLIMNRDPQTILEVGTGNGYSTLWICLAMNITAKFVTIDEVARDFQHTDKRMKKLYGTLESKLDEVPDKLDFIFLDTDHQIHNIVKDIEMLLPRMHKGTMVVIHDTEYCPEMGKCLQDYFGGNDSERLKTIPIQPSKLEWSFKNIPTQYGLGTAILEGEPNADVQA